MPRPLWFRSLYWRIALGFVAMLAALLLVQGMLFLWLTGRFAESLSGRTPQQLADQVARELSEALSDNAALDLQVFVKEKYSGVPQAFAVVMRDGRRALNRPGALPPGFGERPGRRPPFGEGGPGLPPDRGDPAAAEHRPPASASGDRNGPPPDFLRRRGGGRGGPGGPPHISPIVVSNIQVGVVAVPNG